MRGAAGNARDDVLEARPALQEIREAGARLGTDRLGDAVPVRAPVDEHHVGTGFRQRLGEIDARSASIDAVRLARDQRAEPADVRGPGQKLARQSPQPSSTESTTPAETAAARSVPVRDVLAWAPV